MNWQLLEKLPGQIDWAALKNSLLEKEKAWQAPHHKKIQEALKGFYEQYENELSRPLKISVKKGVITGNSSQPNQNSSFLKDIEKTAKSLGPWLKGPFQIDQLVIDGEWRSELKWQRLAEHLPELKNKNILDIGCNNGYFMFRIAESEPNLVLGVDPIPRVQAQFEFLQRFFQVPKIQHALWGIEDIRYFQNSFDVIFSMGILYHHKNPIQQLMDLRQSLNKGGVLILETIGIPGDLNTCLSPEKSYAKMRNIWFLPTLPCLLTWLKRCQYKNLEVINTSWQGSKEQRSTLWAEKDSYEDFLNPKDSSKTIEGHPAPRRFIIKAEK